MAAAAVATLARYVAAYLDAFPLTADEFQLIAVFKVRCVCMPQAEHSAPCFLSLHNAHPFALPRETMLMHDIVHNGVTQCLALRSPAA